MPADLADRTDFDNANRGLIARLEPGVIKTAEGRDEISRFLAEQRDLSGSLHDQTLRLLNKGLTGSEIAEVMEVPPALDAVWHTHGYYGSVSHNVKAIYQRYPGWYDSNPAHLWQHPRRRPPSATPGWPAARISSPPGPASSSTRATCASPPSWP